MTMVRDPQLTHLRKSAFPNGNGIKIVFLYRKLRSMLDEQHCVLISGEFSVKQLQILFGDLRAGWITPAFHSSESWHAGRWDFWILKACSVILKEIRFWNLFTDTKASAEWRLCLFVYETLGLAEITFSMYMHTCILSHLASSLWCFEPGTDNFQGLGLKRCMHVTPSATFYKRLQSSSLYTHTV